MAGNDGFRMSAVKALTDGEARRLLGELLEANPHLRSEAKEMARRLLEDVMVDGVAEDVIWALESIPMTELTTRSGRIQGRGYVDEHEAAWELVDEELAAFLDDIRRRARLGLTEPAATVATGVVAGLYRIGQPDDLTVLVMAGDAAALELAGEVFALVADLDLALPADAAQHWPDWSDG